MSDDQRPALAASAKDPLWKGLKVAVIGAVPPLGLYVAYRIAGLYWGIGVGASLSVITFPIERRITQKTRFAWLGLAGVAVGVVLTLITGNPKLFFIRQVAWEGLFGLAMLTSVLIRKPLLGLMGRWVQPMPDFFVESWAYSWGFGLPSLVFGLVFVGKSILKSYLIAQGTLDQVVAVQLLLGWPVLVPLMVFAMWYPRRVAKRWMVSLGVDPADAKQMLKGTSDSEIDMSQLAASTPTKGIEGWLSRLVGQRPPQPEARALSTATSEEAGD